MLRVRDKKIYATSGFMTIYLVVCGILSRWDCTMARIILLAFVALLVGPLAAHSQQPIASPTPSNVAKPSDDAPGQTEPEVPNTSKSNEIGRAHV